MQDKFANVGVRCTFGVSLQEEVPAWPRGSYELEVGGFGAVGAETVEAAVDQAVDAALFAAGRTGRRYTFHVYGFCPCLQKRPRGRCKLCGGGCREYLASGRVLPGAP